MRFCVSVVLAVCVGLVVAAVPGSRLSAQFKDAAKTNADSQRAAALTAAGVAVESELAADESSAAAVLAWQTATTTYYADAAYYEAVMTAGDWAALQAYLSTAAAAGSSADADYSDGLYSQGVGWDTIDVGDTLYAVPDYDGATTEYVIAAGCFATAAGKFDSAKASYDEAYTAAVAASALMAGY